MTQRIGPAEALEGMNGEREKDKKKKTRSSG
jgi:hypothetical protein